VKPLFTLGHVVATPGALAAIGVSGDDLSIYLARHQSADWGDVDAYDGHLIYTQSLVLVFYSTLPTNRLSPVFARQAHTYYLSERELAQHMYRREHISIHYRFIFAECL
jgi:hypothetical protein